jgi:1,4-alpha-glucan branching enzyme
MKGKSPAPAKAQKPKTLTRRVVFSMHAEPGSEVAVSGDFNNWNPEGKKMADKKGDGHYTATMNLAPGIYEYKFIINKTWCVDPVCKDWVPNSLGTLNSILHVE